MLGDLIIKILVAIDVQKDMQIDVVLKKNYKLPLEESCTFDTFDYNEMFLI